MARIPAGRGPRYALLALLVLVLLIAFMPLRIALGLAGLGDGALGARTVDGTIWSGRLVDSSIAGQPLGTLDASVAPLPLLIGRVAMTLGTPPDRTDLAPLNLTLIAHGDGAAVEQATGTLPIGAVFQPLPIDSFALDGVSAAFDDGRCIEARGTIRAAVTQNLPGFTLSQGLAGTARCDGDAVLLPLKGQTGLDAFDIRIGGDGRYTADLSLGGIDPGIAPALANMGFRRRGDTLVRRLSGRL